MNHGDTYLAPYTDFLDSRERWYEVRIESAPKNRNVNVLWLKGPVQGKHGRLVAKTLREVK